MKAQKLTIAEAYNLILARITKEQDDHNEYLEIKNALLAKLPTGKRLNKTHFEKALPAGYTLTTDRNGYNVIAPSGNNHGLVWGTDLNSFSEEGFADRDAPYNNGAFSRAAQLIAIAEDQEKLGRLVEAHNKMCDAYELLVEAQKAFGSGGEFGSYPFPMNSEFRQRTGFDHRIFDQLLK